MDLISLLIIAIIILSLLFIKKSICYSIIIANFIIFLITPLFYPLKYILNDLAFSPNNLINYKIYTIFTSMYIHGSVWHIIGNMLVLFFIGVPFEYRVGVKKFALIYFLGGMIGNIFYSIARWGSHIFLIGASGAIFSILGAFAVAYPKDEIVVFMPLIFMRMKVITAAILMALLQIFLIVMEEYIQFYEKIAYLAHLGGLVGGILLSIVFIRGEEKVLDIGWDSLESLAITQKQKEIFKKIKEADLPDVKEAWLSKFLEITKCPRCNGKLIKEEGVIKCSDCDFFIKL